MTTDNTDALRIVSKFVGAHNSSLDVCEFGERCDDFIEEARAVLVASSQAPAAPAAPAEPVMPEPCAYRFDGMEGTATTIWHYSDNKPQVTAFAVHPLCTIEAARTYAESLAAERVAQHKADSERYRWRQQQHEDRAYAVFAWDDDCFLHGADLDAAIDAARATGEQT